MKKLKELLLSTMDFRLTIQWILYIILFNKFENIFFYNSTNYGYRGYSQRKYSYKIL